MSTGSERKWYYLRRVIIALVGLLVLGSAALQASAAFPTGSAASPPLGVPGQKADASDPWGVAGYNCANLERDGIAQQMNQRAGAILAKCMGTDQPKQPDSQKGDSGRTGVAAIDKLLAPLTGGVDKDMNVGETTNRSQAESWVWGNGNTIVVTFNDFRGITLNPILLCGASTSTDGGATFTWLPGTTFSGLGQCGGDPFHYWSARANKWFAGFFSNACGANGIGQWESVDGINWTTSGCTHTGSNDDRFSGWVDNVVGSPFFGFQYVIFSNFALTNAPLQAVRSTDDGVTWSAPVTLSSRPGGGANRPVQITGSPTTNGWVFAQSMDEGGGGLANRINYIHRSTDGGATWTQIQQGPAFPAPGSGTCPGNAFFAIMPGAPGNWRHQGWGQPGVGPSNVVHYAYAQHGAAADQGDIMYIRSTDGGMTWSSPLILNTDAPAGTRAQWMPSLAVNAQGTVLVGWYDRRNTTGNDYQRFVRSSTDNGVSWLVDKPISDVISPQWAAEASSAACYGGDYDYAMASNSNQGTDFYQTWNDGRVIQGGVNQMNVFFDKASIVGGPTATGTLPTATRTSTTTNTPIPPSATATICAFTNALTEGFESGTLGAFTQTVIITSTTTPVPTPGWASVAANPHSGTRSAFAPDPDRTTDSRLTTISNIVIPSGVTTATLSFWHRFSFENLFDGGVLEVSTDGGGTWTDADPNIQQGGYNGTITIFQGCVTAGTPPPFPAGKRVWTGSMTAYAEVRVNLLPYVNTNMKFRFRLGTDCSVANTGWNIDDVSVSYGGSCVTTTITPPVSTSTSTSTTVPPTSTRTNTVGVGTSTATATACVGGQVILYDQLNSPGTFSTNSQDFEAANNAFDNQTADDFIVPAGATWNVNQVDAQGLYFNGPGPAASFNVYFYSSVVSGTYFIPGAAVYTATGQSYINTAGVFAITLTAPAALPGGGAGTRYFVSVQARQDFTPAGQWGWTNRTVLSNSGATWRNPGGGFGPGCVNWDSRTVCVGQPNEPDQMFRLRGTTGGACITTTPTSTLPVSTSTRTNTPVGATSTRTNTPPVGATSTVCVPGAWTFRAPFNAGNIVRGLGIWYPPNGKFYVLGGRNNDTSGSDYRQPHEYDPVANTWITKTAVFTDGQVNNMAGGVMTVPGFANPVIVMVGGSAAGLVTSTNVVRVYDPIADTLTTLGDNWPQTPTGSTLPGGFAVQANKLYIIGGFTINTAMLNTIWEFDPTDPVGSRWTQKSAVLPVPMGYIPATTIGSLIFTGGGTIFGSGLLTDTTNSYVYNPVGDSISPIVNIPRATGETRAVTVGNEMWVLGGGRTPPNPSNQVDIYNPGSGTWRLGIPFTTPRRNLAADSDGSRVFVAGGYTGPSPGTPINTLEVFTGGVCPTGTPQGATSTSTRTSTSTSTTVPNTPTRTNTVGVGTPTCVPGGGSWRTEPSMSTARRGPGVAVVGNFLYAATGFNAAPDYTNIVERFDGAVWSTVAPIPTPHAQSRAAAVGTKMYVPGGYNSIAFTGPLNSMQIYDSVANSWSQGAALPAVRSGAAVVEFNGKVYIIAGFTAPFPTPANTVYEYDPVANTYATKSPMPGAGSGNLSGTVHNGEIYVVGGSVAQAYAYNPVTDAWRPLAAFPQADCQSDGAFTLDGKIWVVGCLNRPISQQVFVYDPVANTWAPGTLYTSDHAGPGAALFQGRGFVVGGGLASGGSTSVESIGGGTCATPGITSTIVPPTITPGATATCTTNFRVLIAHGDCNVFPTTLRDQILAEGASVVDVVDAGLSTPSLAQMLTYNVVVVFNDCAYLDNVALGNNLADYQDAGGVPVVFTFAWGSPNLDGRWQTGGYSPFNLSTGTDFTAHTLGTYNAGHPLMQGIGAGSLSAFYVNILSLTSGASSEALWDNQQQLVAHKTTSGHTAVGVNAYVGDGAGQWSGPFGRIVMNAARWLAGGPCITPGPTNTPATATPTVCVANYSVAASTGATIVPGTTMLAGTNCDDCSVAFALPFPFNFYGTSFNSVNVISNGSLQFSSTNTDFTNACEPYAAHNNVIHAYWDDILLTTAGDGVYTSVSGSAPNRIVNIEWRGCYYSGGSCGGPVNVEARLYEGSGQIDVIYAVAGNGNASATGGVQRGTGSLFLQAYCDGVGLPVTAGTMHRYTQGACGSVTPSPQPSATNTATATNTVVGVTNTATSTSTATNTPAAPSATPTACVMKFEDVHPEDWFYGYVEWMYCNGIVSGYNTVPPCSTPGRVCYKPGNPTTRGQLAKIVVRAFDFPIDTTGGPHFQDVGTGHTFYQYVETAYNLGLIVGYPCGGPGEPCVPPDNKPYYRSNKSVTRAQITKIMVSAAIIADPGNWKLENPPDNTFQDVPVGSTFFRYIETAYSHHIIEGYPCGTPPAGPCVPPGNRRYFLPNADATRAQIAKITYLAVTYPPQRASNTGTSQPAIPPAKSPKK
ncbi:MAG: S-layer homology domain-containing protein [Chloroflexia bacterium]